MEAMLQFVVTLGLSSTLTLYFVWKADKREDRMAARIDTLEDFQRTQLVILNEKTTAALLENAATSRAGMSVIAELQKSLREHHEFALELEKKLQKSATT